MAIADFQLRSVPLLSRVGADRADQLRTDVEAAAAGWADAALLRVDSRNQALVADGRVVLGAAAELGDKPRRRRCFWGASRTAGTYGPSAARCRHPMIPRCAPRW
ncbi:putative nADH pyrophosphatase nudC [Mycobacterium avium subsp. avium 2285 (R)]|nr:putative nADH pyrophosphatase nudC [Mycobacterium avium subsp. avium 2285 (R)]